MSQLTGTGVLTRFIVRRDRIRILCWVAGVVALVALTAAGIKGLFPTQAALDHAAAATLHNAAVIAFNGSAQGLDSVGGEVAFQSGAVGMVVAALMSIFMIGRLTRGEEEAGRLELVRSLPVGGHAPTLAAAIVVTAMNVVVGMLTTVVLLTMNLPRAGSVVFGTSFIVVGLVFAGVALLAAQVTENTRVVYGAGGALLGAAFILRAVGDIGDGTVSWFSPIGIAQKTRPFAGERWWPFLPLLAVSAALVAMAGAAGARRDLGAGLVASRGGHPTASRSLGHPLGLAVRLQRGSLIGWGIGILVTGVAYGWIAPTVDSFVSQNKALADLFAGKGGASLIDSYFATSFRVMALLATGFAIQSALRLRSEETSMHAEAVLATPISRWRWAASHLVVAFAGSVLLLGVAGLATGLSYAAAGGNVASVPRLLGAILVYVPPVWLMIGLTLALLGLAPRATGASWLIYAFCFVIGFVGAVLPIPNWLVNLSPFQRVPMLPAAPLSVLPLVVIIVIAVAFTAVGLAGLRQRDIG